VGAPRCPLPLLVCGVVRADHSQGCSRRPRHELPLVNTQQCCLGGKKLCQRRCLLSPSHRYDSIPRLTLLHSRSGGRLRRLCMLCSTLWWAS
jgi:hypothetical protein